MTGQEKRCNHWPGQTRCGWCDLGKDNATLATNGLTARAKIVAQILTDNGHQVDPPDDHTLDDVEWGRWKVCLQIVQAISEDTDGDMQEALDRAEEDVREGAGFDRNSYGAGYDTGYRDAMRRALCILRGLDDDE